MATKLHTSENTEKIFKDLGQSLGLQPYILAKIAIALSIRQGSINEGDINTDNNGLELSRQTIFGEYDLIFKSLIQNCQGYAVTGDTYFPTLVKAHLDRGAKLLENEKRYTRDFYNHMCKLDDNI